MKKYRDKKNFWDNEYKEGNHLTLSTKPSEDLIKFAKWIERTYGEGYLTEDFSVLDLGCGNGRNLIHLAETYGVSGVGYDISKEAVLQAQKASEEKDLSLEYGVRSIKDPLPLPDNSQIAVLDMMTSHFLNKQERSDLLDECVRVLKPGGWLYIKTFLRDQDLNAEELLRDHPAEEEGSYIHPVIGLPEHVFTERELREDLESHFFTIEKISKSHQHMRAGKPYKRRSISVYAQRTA